MRLATSPGLDWPATRPRLESLYPADLDDAPVDWESMQIPGSPARYRTGPADPRCINPGSRWAKSLIQQYRVQADSAGVELLEFVDKTSPHARHDLMCCYAGPGQDGTIAGLPVPAQTLLWATALNFIRHCQAPGDAGAPGQVWIAYNSDPHTEDRPSCQGEKRFHLHLIHWRESELAGLQRRPFATLDRAQRRRLIDPFVYLGARICADKLASVGLRERLAISPLPSRAPGLRLIPRGPASGASLQRDILALHELIDAGCAELQAALLELEQPRAIDLRPPLRPLTEIADRLARITWLAPATRAQLLTLAAALDSPDTEQQRALQAQPELAARRLTLRMPAYALGLRPLAAVARRRVAMSDPQLSDSTLELVVQFKLLSDIGGAGVVELGDLIAAKIGRNAGAWSLEQWRERARFQTGFLRANLAKLERDTSVAMAMSGLEVSELANFGGFERGWCRGGSR